MEYKMGSKLILLLGLIVGALLTFFCVNKDKREDIFNYTKSLNRDTPKLKHTEAKEPIATKRIEDVKEQNSTVAVANKKKANREKLEQEKLAKLEEEKIKREKIREEELQKLKDTEDKIAKLLKDNPIYFETSSTTIKKSSRKGLNMIAEALKDISKKKGISDKTVVVIKGHTDASGDASQNKKLSQKRADSVVSYLKKRGLDSLNMRAIGYGEEQPVVASNPNDKLNRRVEIELQRGE